MLPNTATLFDIILDVISDVLISLAYFVILLEFIYFIKRYPITIPKEYKRHIIIFKLFIFLGGLTHAFNALRFGIGVTLCTKISTAIISPIAAVFISVLIPGVLKFLKDAKGWEGILMGPETSTSPQVTVYSKKSQASARPRFADVVSRVMANKNGVTS